MKSTSETVEEVMHEDGIQSQHANQENQPVAKSYSKSYEWKGVQIGHADHPCAGGGLHNIL